MRSWFSKINGKAMEKLYGESEPMSSVVLAARLPFGVGAVGKHHGLETPEQEAEFAQQLDAYVRPLTVANTADCVDDRPTVALGDGTNDPEVLSHRVVYQLAGGLGLAVTKAAVGADAAYLRDAKDIKDAYLTTVDLLVKVGFTEAGHKDCGASKSVEKSVANELPEDQLLVALPALTNVDEKTGYYLQRNWETKRQRLEAGFYGTWSNGWHEDFLSERFARNFSILAEDPNDHETYGHQALGVLSIQKDGYGFAKTAFARETGRMAFADTPTLIEQILFRIGGSDEERARLALELGVDPAQVLNGLTYKNFPAFLKAA